MGKKQQFKPSNAEKAFVYQQTQDLVSSLNETAPISVLLEKFSSSDPQNMYAVTFTLGTAPINVLARSEGKDLLEVCMSAKNEMKKKLNIIAQSIGSSPQRSRWIEQLKKNPYLH